MIPGLYRTDRVFRPALVPCRYRPWVPRTPRIYLYNRRPVCYAVFGNGGAERRASVPTRRTPAFLPVSTIPQAHAPVAIAYPYLQLHHPTTKQFDSNGFITNLESICCTKIPLKPCPVYMLRKQAGGGLRPGRNFVAAALCLPPSGG